MFRGLDREFAEFEPQQVAIPSGEFGEVGLGDDVGPLLCFGEVLDPNHRDGVETERLRRLESAVSGDHPPRGIGEDRVQETEAFDRAGDLSGRVVRALRGDGRKSATGTVSKWSTQRLMAEAFGS